jgi:YidC/Oxa1 family membrane protein insertase
MNDNTKNMLMAAALSLIFIGLWDYFYAFPEMERQKQATLQQQRMAKVPKLGAPDQATLATPAKPLVRTRAEALAESPRVTIDTPSIAGSIALKGARFDDVSLKHYRQTVDPTSPIITLLSPENGPEAYFAELGFVTAETENAPPLPTTETLWTADSDRLTPARPLTLTWDNGQGLVFRRVISVDDEYMFTVKASVENKSGKPVSLNSFSRVMRIGRPPSSGYAALHEGFVGTIGDVSQEVTYDKIEKEPNFTKTFKGTGGWVGFTDKYWGAVVAPEQSAAFEARYMAMGAGATKTYQADTVTETKTIEPGATAEATAYVFAGAKEVDLLNAYAVNPGLKRFGYLIDWGWFYFITQPMFKLIDFLYRVLGNFGLAILAVTVIVKLAFLPLANKSYQSIAKMKEIQPKIKELKEKYGDDKHKFNMEQMELYKREKINPASGCFPVLLQIPVFFSLYKVLVVTIEMRHAPFFGWIKDLSAPDPTNVFNLFGLLPFDPTHVAFFGPYLVLGVWPLIMGVTMWLQMKMNPEPTDEIQKTMFSWMPVMFTFTMGGFASGLIIYWSWNNLLSIIQQGVIMKRAGVKFELWDNLRKTFGLA